jgi:hypothetical protein
MPLSAKLIFAVCMVENCAVLIWACKVRTRRCWRDGALALYKQFHGFRWAVILMENTPSYGGTVSRGTPDEKESGKGEN